MSETTENPIREAIAEAIKDHEVLLFMKGTPDAPRCGFSMRVVQVLDQMDVEYGAIDVLPALQPLREVTAEIADWQTFPQLYVKGDHDAALEIHYGLHPLVDLLFVETNPAPVKWVLAHRGLIRSGHVRPPLVAPGDAGLAAIRALP